MSRSVSDIGAGGRDNSSNSNSKIILEPRIESGLEFGPSSSSRSVQGLAHETDDIGYHDYGGQWGVSSAHQSEWGIHSESASRVKNNGTVAAPNEPMSRGFQTFLSNFNEVFDAQKLETDQRLHDGRALTDISQISRSRSREWSRSQTPTSSLYFEAKLDPSDKESTVEDGNPNGNALNHAYHSFDSQSNAAGERESTYRSAFEQTVRQSNTVFSEQSQSQTREFETPSGNSVFYASSLTMPFGSEAPISDALLQDLTR